MPREAGITVRELKTVLSNSDILGDGADSSLTFEFEREVSSLECDALH